jgi:cytochrome d ubiquinol oxidase subunit I
LSGWTVTEVGRQPFVVYGHLRTADAISPVAGQAVFGSLALFVIIYTILLLAFFFYAMRTVLRGPQVEQPEDRPAAVRPGLDSAPAGLSGE